MNRHRDPTFATSFPEVGKWPIHVQISHYATVACRRLDRIGSTGKKQAKKSIEEEINQVRVSETIFFMRFLCYYLIFFRIKYFVIVCLVTH